MRAPAIHIAMPAGVANMRRTFEGKGRSRHQPEARTPFKFTARDGSELKRPAVQGYACLYNTAFFVGGVIRAALPGSFIDTLYDGKTKSLCFDHIKDRAYGDTASGLEFATTPDGLAFRMPINDDADGHAVYDAIMSGARPCVSIGAEVVSGEIRKLRDGTEYQAISKCSVQEISLVEQGAVAETYASIVDLDQQDPRGLWFEARKPSFAVDKAYANIIARADRIAKALKSA